MSEPSFASLNPSLLARKGGAKPAMRPQAGIAVPKTATDLDDLGWNDMGQDENPSDNIVQIDPEIKDATPAAKLDAPSPVRQQHDEISARLESEPAKPAAKAKPAKSARKSEARRSALKQGRRAAFTLRLDAERHLKLRLAATINGVSAQNFVTEALDAQLATIDDLDTLTAKIKSD